MRGDAVLPAARLTERLLRDVRGWSDAMLNFEEAFLGELSRGSPYPTSSPYPYPLSPYPLALRPGRECPHKSPRDVHFSGDGCSRRISRLEPCM